MEADEIGKRLIKVAESIEKLGIALNKLTTKTSVEALVQTFEFDDLIEVQEAIDYYEEREIYNACEALDIIMTNRINELIQ